MHPYSNSCHIDGLRVFAVQFINTSYGYFDISTRAEYKIEAKSKCIDVGQLDCLVPSLHFERVEFTRRPYSLSQNLSRAAELCNN